MADNKVLINLTTGLEDGERITVALVVVTAALSASKQVTTWLTNEAERLAVRGFPEAVTRDGIPAASATVRADRSGPQ
jgi:predicted peroxiredoxin